MNTLMVFAAEGPNGQFIPSDPKELYWGAAAFAIVMFFLVTKLFPQISKALGERGDSIRDELAAAEQAQAAADAEVAAMRAKLGDAEADAAKLVADAREQADKIRSDGQARAAADAEALRQKAAADIEGMRAQAGADIEAEVSAKALEVAEEVAMANLDDATQAQLIDQYIDQVRAAR